MCHPVMHAHEQVTNSSLAACASGISKYPDCPSRQVILSQIICAPRRFILPNNQSCCQNLSRPQSAAPCFCIHFCCQSTLHAHFGTKTCDCALAKLCEVAGCCTRLAANSHRPQGWQPKATVHKMASSSELQAVTSRQASCSTGMCMHCRDVNQRP